MQWNDGYVREVERTISQRVEAAGYYLVSRVRENISIPSRVVRYTKNAKGEHVKRLGPRGSNRSNPGEFVHKDRGALRQSIAQQHFPEEAKSLVGTASKVGRWIELGTKKMAPRKMLRATLAEERERLRQMIEHGGTSDIKVGS